VALKEYKRAKNEWIRTRTSRYIWAERNNC